MRQILEFRNPGPLQQKMEGRPTRSTVPIAKWMDSLELKEGHGRAYQRLRRDARRVQPIEHGGEFHP